MVLATVIAKNPVMKCAGLQDWAVPSKSGAAKIQDLPIRLAQAPLSRSLPQDEAICHYTKYRIVASC